MSMRNPAWKKLFFARPRLTALVTAVAAATGFAITSVGTAYASGQNCAPDSAGQSSICMHIDGSSNVVADAIGSVKVTNGRGVGEWAGNGNWVTFNGHVQVVNPNGTTLCNSNTITLSYNAGTSCESSYQGATYTGAYCTILWVWTGSEYIKWGQECLNVFK
jgi:hypothetical protein